ncbi:MAG: signal recognition particle-docking protein FtsY [Deltaproteobacteria bacterium]|nr:signal recognition particle-docking protein FtsY [Deltaproteobacteria bacterium]
MMVWVIVAVVVIAVIIFLVTRKPSEPALPEAKKPEALEPKEKPARKDDVLDALVPRPAKTVKETPSARREEPREEPRPREEAPAAKPSERPKPALEEDFGKPAVFDPATVRKGLARTRGGMIARLRDLISGRKVVDPALLSEIEEVLLTSDVGVKTSQKLIQRLHERLERNELDDEEKVWAALRAEAEAILGAGGRLKLRTKPTVVLMVGVNGTGKTTTIGKLASKLKAQGKSVILGAGDTFRAAAVQQLEVWGEREGAVIVKGKEGADPSSVLFDAVTRAKETNTDVVLCDTAGRLQTKTNLMDELAKIRRTVAKALDGAPHETLLVLDATNGQNAIQQARLFMETVPLTGIVLTKLDGTAKGGVILAIADELSLPVRYIGIGERAADLREFDAAEFVEALFAGRDAVSNEAA